MKYKEHIWVGRLSLLNGKLYYRAKCRTGIGSDPSWVRQKRKPNCLKCLKMKLRESMAIANKQKVKVKQTADEPVAIEVLAQSIADMGAAVRKLNDSRLKRDALIILLSDATKQSKRQVGIVLSALDQLEQMYLKPNRQN